jgi:hypothetical protein
MLRDVRIVRPGRVSARDHVKGLGWRWGKCREVVVGYAMEHFG